MNKALSFLGLEPGITYGVGVKTGLISDAKGRILEVHEGWVLCPDCRRGRLLPLHPDTAGRMIPAYCKRCRRQHFLNIDACARAPEPVPVRMD